MKLLKKWFFVKALVVLCLFLSTQAHAFFGINPSITNNSKNIEGSIFLNLSTIDYEPEGNGDNFEVERKIIGGNLAFSLNNKVDVFATAGYIFDAEYEDTQLDSDGGLHAGGGIRANVYKQGKLSVNVYGQLDYLIFDKFTSNGTDVELSGFDITGGGIVNYGLTRVVSLWGGIEIIPFSDYESEVGSSKTDFERADFLGIRLGANFGLESWTLRVELAFAGEQALVFSGSTRF